MHRHAATPKWRIVVRALFLALAISALSPLSAQAVSWKRLYGKNSLDTMCAIVNEGWSSSSTAVIATNKSFQDALSASALAGSNGCPVLMTAQDQLSNETKRKLVALGTKKVYLCGGPVAISPSVEQALQNMGLSVERLWGQTSPDTAVAIFDRIQKPATTCVLATNAHYADALSAAAYSYAKRAPIFLTSQKGTIITPATLDAIARGGFNRVVIAGGPAAVSRSVEQQVAALGIEVVRIGGQNRYDTSGLLAQFAASEGLSWNNMGIATGRGYKDALAGAALSGKKKAVLVLADREKTATLQTVMTPSKASIKTAYLYGGTSAVSATVPNFLDASVFSPTGSTTNWKAFLGTKLSDDYAEWRRQWILNRIDNNLSTYDRVKLLQVFISSFPYDRSRIHHTAYDMYKYGNGTCVSSSEMMEDFCTDLGITCVVRDASADVGQVHYNNYVWINGDPYIVDANPGSNGKLRFGPA